MSALLHAPETTHTRTVRLFRNGANQAVRIPKEFELAANEATMRREGSALIIEPLMTSTYPVGSIGALADSLLRMKDWPDVQEPFPGGSDDLAPLSEVQL